MKNYNVYYGILLLSFYSPHALSMDPHSPRSLRSRLSRKGTLAIRHVDQPSFPNPFNQKNDLESLAKYRYAFANRLFTQDGSRQKNHSTLIKIQEMLGAELSHIDQEKLRNKYSSEDLQAAHHIVDLNKDCLACIQFINRSELYEAEKIVQRNPYLAHYYFIVADYQTDMGTLVHYVLNKALKEPNFRTPSSIILRSLLKNGSNPNATDKAGNTPMHLASSTKHIEILRKWGACSDYKNKKNQTPLYKIKSYMPESHLEIYLGHTVPQDNFNTQNLDETFKKLLLYQASFIRKLLTQQGRTISDYNALRKVQIILQKGLLHTNPNTLQASYDPETLHLIRCVIDLDKDCQIWKQLIHNNELSDAENIIERNPYLVQYYFTDSVQPNMGTMVHYILNKTRHDVSFRNNSYLVLQSLLKNGANPNLVDRRGNTPMHLVSCITHVEILLRWGGYTNQKNKDSKTPLMKIYADIKNSPILAFLLYAGVNPNTQDAQGDTVFHHAVKCKDYAGCCTFLAYSASFMIPNKENKTPACCTDDFPGIRKLMEPYIHRFLWENLQTKNFKAVEECILKYPWLTLEHNERPLMEWIEQSFDRKTVTSFKKILAKNPHSS